MVERFAESQILCLVVEGRVLLLCEMTNNDVEVCEQRLIVFALFEEGNDEDIDNGVPHRERGDNPVKEPPCERLRELLSLLRFQLSLSEEELNNADFVVLA